MFLYFKLKDSTIKLVTDTVSLFHILLPFLLVVCDLSTFHSLRDSQFLLKLGNSFLFQFLPQPPENSYYTFFCSVPELQSQWVSQNPSEWNVIWARWRNILIGWSNPVTLISQYFLHIILHSFSTLSF